MTSGATAVSVPLLVQHQERPEWCWVAVAVSVDKFFRPASTHIQCEVAGAVLDLPCCNGVQPANSEACNQPHTLHPVLGRYHLLAAAPIVKPLTFDEVCNEIDGGRPVCVLIKWLDGKGNVTNRGHFIAVNGYRVTPGGKLFVSITDPMYGSSEVAFALFSSSTGGYRDGRGVWFASFLVANEAAS